MTLIDVKNELVRIILLNQRKATRGRPRSASLIEILDKIIYVCRTGCQWRAIDMLDGIPFQTVYHWFRVWSKMTIFEKTFYSLSSHYRETHKNPVVADTSFVKNVFGRDGIGSNRTDRGRNATKVSLLADSQAVPLALRFHRGNRSDFHTLRPLLAEATRKCTIPLSAHKSLYADKGYDSHDCRSICTSSGLEPHIPKRGEPSVWGGIRVAVERCFGRIDKFRRCLMRFDSKICHFKSFHFLACSHIFP